MCKGCVGSKSRVRRGAFETVRASTLDLSTRESAECTSMIVSVLTRLSKLCLRRKVPRTKVQAAQYFQLCAISAELQPRTKQQAPGKEGLNSQSKTRETRPSHSRGLLVPPHSIIAAFAPATQAFPHPVCQCHHPCKPENTRAQLHEHHHMLLC